MKSQQITTWNEILDFYSELRLDSYGESYKNLMEEFKKLVVEKTAGSVWAQYLFASQSLFTLIISTKQECPDRILVAHVRVSPNSNDKVVIELFDAPIHRGDAGVCKTKIVYDNENVYTNLEPLMKILTEQMNPLLEAK